MAEVQVTDARPVTQVTVSGGNSGTSVSVSGNPAPTVVGVSEQAHEHPVTAARSGAQGPTGPQGEQGIAGEQSVYVQPTQPTGLTRDYLWVQTGLGPTGTDWTLWFEDNDGTP